MSAKKEPVAAGELERDVLAFIARKYSGRHLGIDEARLGLSLAAYALNVAHLRAVAEGGKA